MKTYRELNSIQSFDERLAYLRTHSKVGNDSFGFDRYLNQAFYRSSEWKRLREQIFIRDNGCDLGVPGYDILDKRSVVIHHINPITIEDFKEGSNKLLDPDNLITTSTWTHNIIHYGLENEIRAVISRSPNDTCPWKQ